MFVIQYLFFAYINASWRFFLIHFWVIYTRVKSNMKFVLLSLLSVLLSGEDKNFAKTHNLWNFNHLFKNTQFVSHWCLLVLTHLVALQFLQATTKTVHSIHVEWWHVWHLHRVIFCAREIKKNTLFLDLVAAVYLRFQIKNFSRINKLWKMLQSSWSS